MTATGISGHGGSSEGGRPGGTTKDRTPYTVTASSSLSEDHFLVRPGKFDPSRDKVVTYVHDDIGTLEAMIVQGGILSQLYHDPSRDGAWALEPVKVGATDVVGVVDVVAGRPLDSADKVGALHVFCRTATTVLHLVQAADRSWTATDLGWHPSPQVSSLSLQTAEDPNGGVFVYWITEGTGGKYFNDAVVHICMVDRGPDGETTRTGTATGLATLVSGLSAVARLSRSAGNLQLWVFTANLYVNQVFVTSFDENLDQVGATRVINPDDSRVPLARPLGSVAKFQAVFSMDETKPPYAIAEGKIGQLWTLIYDPETTQPTKPWRWTSIWNMPHNFTQDRAFAGIRSLPRSESSDPAARADKVLDVYVLLGTSLWVVRQQPTGSAGVDSTHPIFGPAVALQGKVATASLPSTRGSGTGMMFIDTDGELQTLTQDPVSGAWTDNPVHLPATEPLELTTFRTQLNVADTWGQPVIGTTVQVSAESPTIAMINGKQASLSPGTTVPATSDVTGRIVVAVPATGLAAPKLTISGANLAEPLPVYPSGPINDYLTGTTSLHYLPPLTADVLSAAPLGASGLTQDRAKASVDVITNAAKAAIPPALRTGEQRTIRSSYTEIPVQHTSQPLQVGNLEFSVSDFFHEVVHAIKTGAATVSYAVKNAAATVAHWAVDIVVTCGDFIDHLLTVAITDLHAAADVIHSVASWIGSTVDAFLDWLKAQILSLLHDTVALAGQYEQWIRTAAADYLPPLIKTGKGNAVAWLQQQGTAIKTALDKSATTLSGKSLTDLGKPPARLSTSPEAVAAGANPLVPDVNGAHANWLLDKLQADLGGIGTVAPISGLDTLLGDLSKNLATVLKDFKDAAIDLWKALGTALTRPQDIATTGVSLLIDALKKVVDAAITFAVAAVETLCDATCLTLQAFGHILDTSLDSLPLIGPLLKIAGLKSPTLGGLVTLMIAFPTVLAYKIAHGSKAVPFQASLADSRPGERALGSDIADDLSFTAAGALGFWAFADAIAATLSLLPDEGLPDPAKTQSVTLWGVVDAAAPFVVGALTIPTERDALPFTAPPKINAELFSWLSGLFPGIGSAMVMSIPAANPNRKSVEDLILVATSGAGAFAIFSGLLAAWADETPWSVAKYGALILCSLPVVGAIGLTEAAKDSTDDFSVGLQVANCLICGGLGAIATAFAD
jgi:hypothetical protein